MGAQQELLHLCIKQGACPTLYAVVADWASQSKLAQEKRHGSNMSDATDENDCFCFFIGATM